MTTNFNGVTDYLLEIKPSDDRKVVNLPNRKYSEKQQKYLNQWISECETRGWIYSNNRSKYASVVVIDDKSTQSLQD